MAQSSSVVGSGTTSSVVSLKAFHRINWAVFAVCFTAFASRIYIRFHCFRRLLVDDWIMMFAFALLLSVIAIGQAFLDDVYKEIEFENGRLLPDETLPRIVERGLHGFGAAGLISLIGISAIKINFLVFFKRLGTRRPSYHVFWYIVLFLTLACGSVNIGLVVYECVFTTFGYLMKHCSSRSILLRYYNFQKVSVSLDVFSDALIVIFPIVILWNVRIGQRKKIILSCTFGLVALTIAVTIVRGSIFGGAYKTFDSQAKTLNIAWMWFWLFIEFSVAFFIACLISYRALFTQVRFQHLAIQGQLDSSNSTSWKSSSLFRRAGYLHNSLLRTFKELETGDPLRLPEPESGRFSPTFLAEIENAHSEERGIGAYQLEDMAKRKSTG
ncbi:hypothetical protein BU24DRAFT_497285 [Aaosphaeria arxii CBS 175.79]|uniref:Rhodopsin domain-containing protein n=1 Tax=Aaosphaeria arxii CBS 175.79 TaxID=1450172 RepID=A0A6A5XA31_9PLEO|nr:uncharacterized protein BU24DRAFT_497285 [Aaosphaeria arxii CBS 175.79]KAF2009716.1 hypothetical protein BU24DRAFT_497285 [Aaosphaeria arxii CBS 175.79]